MKKGPAKLNDQKPKPVLGNSDIHGRVNTDNAGGSGPSSGRPIVTKKGGKR